MKTNEVEEKQEITKEGLIELLNDKEIRTREKFLSNLLDLGRTTDDAISETAKCMDFIFNGGKNGSPIIAHLETQR